MSIKIITSIKKIKQIIKKQKAKSKSIGFTPTMGALHLGHMSLIKKSVKQNDFNIVSIYVNKTQFNDINDYKKYPNTLKDDIKKCKKENVDIIFMPKNLYFKDEHLICANKKANILEGNVRKGHFNGVLRVVLKLLNIISANRVYFGQKDAQQLYLVKKMCKIFFINSKIVPCKCKREVSGLAMASRNIYILKNELSDSLKLSKALFMAKKYLFKKAKNKRDKKIVQSKDILNTKKMIQEKLKNLKVEYVDIVDKTFLPYSKNKIKNKKIILNKNNIIIVLAIRLKKTRLIDSIWL